MHHRLLALLALPCTLLLMPACDDGGGDSQVDAILGLDGDATNGGNVFANTCGNGGCHGSDGDSGPAPNLSGNAFSDTQVVNAMVNGVGNMPPQNVSDQEAADVNAYVSTL